KLHECVPVAGGPCGEVLYGFVFWPYGLMAVMIGIIFALEIFSAKRSKRPRSLKAFIMISLFGAIISLLFVILVYGGNFYQIPLTAV
ncbi:MAG: hypothetical protein QXL94_08000, partial [Candidatus Parvarchaeum sp.]